MGSVGCNFHCEHCQNWTISQVDIESVYASDLTPELAVNNALRDRCKSISWTYNGAGYLQVYIKSFTESFYTMICKVQLAHAPKFSFIARDY